MTRILEKADSLLEDLHIWLLESYPIRIMWILMVIGIVFLAILGWLIK